MKNKFLKRKKITPKLKLADLLRRRKITLKQLLDEFGITTYNSLLIRCESMGVEPPTQEVFVEAIGSTVVSSPTEGVVVLEPIRVIDDSTGAELTPDEPLYAIDEPITQQKKRNKKKDTFSNE